MICLETARGFVAGPFSGRFLYFVETGFEALGMVILYGYVPVRLLLPEYVQSLIEKDN